jgi:ABC-type Mn2+/Zn2+ transport system ATPase subunit
MQVGIRQDGAVPDDPVIAIRAEGLAVAYGQHRALDDSDLAVPAGRVTAVIGPNGSGKTTLLHAIAGLVTPVRGRLHVEPGPDGSRARVAIVLQHTEANPHLPLTVRDAVTLGRYAVRGPVRRLRADDRAAVDHALERMGVADLAKRQLAELSGGQRQRVLVAQGLVQDASILLLDEPVTGLDVVSHDRILRITREESGRGAAVVLTTHDLGEAAEADHVVLVARRVVAEGPPAAVLTTERLALAYGSRLVRLDAHTLLLDDAPHHGPDHHGHDHGDEGDCD